MTRRPLVPLLLAFAGGLSAAELLPPSAASPAVLPILFGLPPVLGLVLAFRSARLGPPLLFGLFFLAGALLALHDRTPERVLQSAAARKARVTVQGTVIEPPHHRREVARFPVRVDRILSGGCTAAAGERIYVAVYRNAPRLRPGQRIRFPARLRLFRNFNNPGRWDYEAAMRIRGFSCAASVSDGRSVVLMAPAGTLGALEDALEKLRGPLRDWFRRSLSAPERGLMRALVLGEKQGIDPADREAFQAAGLAHVLAVSGLHVGLVAWLAFTAIRWILSRSHRLLLAADVRKVSALAACLPVTVYALTAGFHVSTQRALIMVLAYLLSVAAGREKDVWSTLCLAALLILAANPQALRTISFQLSFGAVAGILWLAPAIYRRIPNPFEKEGRHPGLAARPAAYAAGLLSATLAAVLFLLPLTVFYFHRISLVSVPANLMVTPLLGLWVLPLGILSALFFPLLPSLAGLLLQGASLGASAMTAVARFLSGLDGAAVWVITPNRFELLLLYAVLVSGIFALRGRFRPLFLASCLVLAADVGYWVHETALRRDLRVTYLDVGQGNAALVQFPRGKRMLVDGGGFRLGDFDVGRMVIAPYLWRQKIARIHTLVLSHPEADHMNGLGFIAKHFSPGSLWYSGDRVESDSYRRFMAIIHAARIDVKTPGDPGIPLEIEGVQVEILHPVPEAPGDETLSRLGTNDRSVVLRLSHAGFSFLFPGDIENRVEALLVRRFGGRLRSDVLLSPHHGSNSSCSEGFLEHVQPAWCVVSAGFGNRFGFPHPEVVARLRAAGACIARTDRHGAVRIVAAPGSLSAEGTAGEPLKGLTCTD
ncbi:MAG: DNA internalization-related competence protein ComEC/Rec2 [Deltaproteobacteria bacterium]|nr:DNA internalization-related competence protein ComEC/Rec2 [Deltaproteobacteria bacterium]